MKKVTFKVEFVKHSIAPKSYHDDSFTFDRDHNGNLLWEQRWWYSAFKNAIDYCHMKGIKAADICMDLSFKARTEEFTHNWGQKKGVMSSEAIPPGTTVAFNAMVADYITESMLRNLLDTMGRYIGLSPYGHGMGYGRFTLLDIEMEHSDTLPPGLKKDPVRKHKKKVSTDTIDANIARVASERLAKDK